MAPNASSMFSFSQTEPSADLVTGSSWANHPEGPQNFQDFPDNGSSHAGDAEEYLFTSGQTTPRGSRTDQPQTSDAMWTAARTVSSAPRMSHAMSRANSSRSSGSCMSQSSSHLSSMDSTGNASALRNGPQPAGSIAGMDSCLLLDADAAAVPHIYWSDYNLDMNLNVENNGVFALTEAGPLHVVPAQMHLGTEAGLPDNSSPSSWDCFSSSISRTSSPATIDDTWLSAPLSPHSSPDLKCQSPSPERKLSMIPEDRNGLAGSQLDDSGLSQALAARRQAVDGESARDHALYKNATINVDGLFHCPWEGQPNCNHKPEKLKCNYDKFVDSHLKPYRCKADSCEGARFSSTACLLRHEREAHGLHGHGDKPYLCVYEGCERAVPGNGFPRQWNLRDHMKRVHNDHRTAAGSPPSAAGAQSAKGRKRKTDVPEPQTAASRKATVKSMPVAEPVASRPLLEQWMDHRRVVEDMVRGLSKPEDSRSLQQITEVQKRLSVMAKMTTELTAMPKLEVFPALGRKSYVSG
ncbi:zinc finger domain-containing protein [Ophiocordyceps sinensis CO18]|uniref:Zinc finger domain-containing protein n=1 Tax=Ophiocordyceps sinensis (strain Co18 / CGMCC 3.14243) TaxID=911162 RepID=T5AC82_OPHSC|nr:zinc finger domain-containing protein [Ophiocordyceps sinensis CO18]